MAPTVVPRAQIPFPLTPGNASDVQLNSQHYNLTTLDQYGFTLFDNGTLSNGSWCYLVLPGVGSMPSIFANGSIAGGTSCYMPYYPIGQRGKAGIAFGVLFAVSLMFSLVCLRKHGSLFLPQEKRFRAIGRRWQWYWMLFVGACGTISCVASVDVDRDYLQSSGILIQTIFWYLMIPGLLACVWEGARHWGSWQERQLYDYDPFSIPHTDRRARVEFYLPLIFYLFAWLNFFMNIPRNWLNFQAQADPWQSADVAAPAATDNRFKAGAILAFFAWVLIPFSLWHSTKHYKENPSRGGVFRRALHSAFGQVPLRFYLSVPLALITVAYAEAQGWLWTINVGRQDVHTGFLYGLGYGPPLLILLINIVAGLRSPNEDLALIQQRIARGRAVDAELGIKRGHRKPMWWSHVASDLGMSNEDKLRRIAGEIGGRRTIADAPVRAEEYEMNPVAGISAREGGGRDKADASAARSPFSDDPDQGQSESATGGEERGRRRTSLPRVNFEAENRSDRRAYSDGSTDSSRTATSQVPPQQIRSMLDI